MADGKRMGLYIPRALIDDTQLSPPLRMVLAAMIEAADEYGVCRLRAREIGEICGMAEAAASQGRLALARAGYVERVRGSTKKGAGSHNFQVLRYRRAVRHE